MAAKYILVQQQKEFKGKEHSCIKINNILMHNNLTYSAMTAGLYKF